MAIEIEILSIARGSVTAPAGCGKTQLIADALSNHRASSPVLVLTHTNAGLAALRARLERAKVPTTSYRIATLDGFAMRLIAKFPQRSGHDPRILEVANPRADYPAIRSAAARLMASGDIAEALRSTYSNILVDEYQDCNEDQHTLVAWAAKVLPTCVLGDPMQAIFGFGGNKLVDWNRDVCSQFPPAGTLSTPWRWKLVGQEELGRWLLHVREQLQAGNCIDLRGAPKQLTWIQLQAGNEDAQRAAAAQTRGADDQGRVLVIGESMNTAGRHLLASRTPGAVVVESVELFDLIHFARNFDTGNDDPLANLVQFAGKCMTGVGAAELIKRVETIRNRRAIKPPSPAESCAVSFANAPTTASAEAFLRALIHQDGVRMFRPEMLRCGLNALAMSSASSSPLFEASHQVRERNRHLGRPVSRRSVGSTLLLKGLEADIVVILHPDQMDARNLYVALTRGARQIVVCSASHVLRP
jgi:DNA helicase-2/ATP-dependent DNA helicase PcrA